MQASSNFLHKMIGSRFWLRRLLFSNWVTPINYMFRSNLYLMRVFFSVTMSQLFWANSGIPIWWAASLSVGHIWIVGLPPLIHAW